MSRQQVVEFVGLKLHRAYLPTNAFEFFPKMRWGGLIGHANVWLQRKAWAYLHSQAVLKPFVQEQTTYKRYVIEPAVFAKAIYIQKREIHDHWLATGRTLLIGAEDYAELMCSPEFVLHASHQFSFQVEAWRQPPQGKRGEWSEPTVFGLEVRVIPWMRGMVVMP